MRGRGFEMLRVALFAMLTVGMLSLATPTYAVSKAEANETAGNFIRLFLKNDDGARRYATGNLDQWREILELHLPGPGRYTGYGIVEIQGSSRNRKAVVRVERAESSELFYLDFDGIGKVTSFYTVEETLAELMEEMRDVLGEICDLELTTETFSELERLTVEQGRVANRIKALLWRHEKLLEAE